MFAFTTSIVSPNRNCPLPHACSIQIPQCTKTEYVSNAKQYFVGRMTNVILHLNAVMKKEQKHPTSLHTYLTVVVTSEPINTLYCESSFPVIHGKEFRETIWMAHNMSISSHGLCSKLCVIEQKMNVIQNIIQQ